MVNKNFVIYIRKNSAIIMVISKFIINFEMTVITLGNVVATAHNICYLRYKIPKYIPVVFHNGSNYDFDILWQACYLILLIILLKVFTKINAWCVNHSNHCKSIHFEYVNVKDATD